MTLPVCRASSYVGDTHRHWAEGNRDINTRTAELSACISPTDSDAFHTWGHLFSGSTWLNMASTKAAVLPVPDWDWAMRFCGLEWKNVLCSNASLIRMDLHGSERLNAFTVLRASWAMRSPGFWRACWNPWHTLLATAEVSWDKARKNKNHNLQDKHTTHSS